MSTFFTDILRLFTIPITFTFGEHTFTFSPLSLGIIILVNCAVISLFNRFTGAK